MNCLRKVAFLVDLPKEFWNLQRSWKQQSMLGATFLENPSCYEAEGKQMCCIPNGPSSRSAMTSDSLGKLRGFFLIASFLVLWYLSSFSFSFFFSFCKDLFLLPKGDLEILTWRGFCGQIFCTQEVSRQGKIPFLRYKSQKGQDA